MSFASLQKARKQKNSLVLSEVKLPESVAHEAQQIQNHPIAPADVSDSGLPALSNLPSEQSLNASAKTVGSGSKNSKLWQYESKLFQQLPSDLEIRTSVENGRSLFVKATSPELVAGSRLLSVTPHVRALSTSNLGLYCSVCQQSAGPSSEPLKRCTKCRIVYYCSVACQTYDWSIHKSECEALRAWKKMSSSPSANEAPQSFSVPGEAIRALGRLLWSRENAGIQSIWSQEVDLMQSHRSSLPTSSHEPLTLLAHSLARYMGLSESPSPGALTRFGISSAVELLDTLSRFTTNSFTLTTPSLTPIGVAISPLVALINHSCTPNAVVVFPRTSTISGPVSNPFEVIAISSIAPGEEILTSYVDISLPYRHRYKELKERYAFECRCRLCGDNRQHGTVDPRQCVNCAGAGCDGAFRLPERDDDNEILRCQKCGAGFSGDMEAIHDAVRLGEEGLDKATALELLEPSRALKYTTNLIPLLSSHLPVTTHPLLGLLRLHQALLISELSSAIATKYTASPNSGDSLPNLVRPPQDEVDQVCAAAARATSGIMGVFPDGHPVRGVAVAELGKLLCVDVEESKDTSQISSSSPGDLGAHSATTFSSFPSGAARLQQARDLLLRARSELKKGFGGDGGEVGREVEECIRNIEKEWTAWRRVLSQGGLKV